MILRRTTRWRSALFGMLLALVSERKLLSSVESSKKIRQFETGATRDAEEGKLDYEAFFSPMVLERRAEYMHLHRIQSDGEVRDGDNWQQGIPLPAYMKSLWRHFFDVWKLHRDLPARTDIQDALCALMFNAEGYLHELLKQETDHGEKDSGTGSRE